MGNYSIFISTISKNHNYKCSKTSYLEIETAGPLSYNISIIWDEGTRLQYHFHAIQLLRAIDY